MNPKNIDRTVDNLRHWPEDQVCRYLATEVRKLRTVAKESQEEFAVRAGIPLRTYKRFEAHGKGRLETFVRVLKTAGRVEYLFMLFPAPDTGTVRRATLDEKLALLRKRSGSTM
jgi:transcriptional regulator with XRE-family HTH domain